MPRCNDVCILYAFVHAEYSGWAWVTCENGTQSRPGSARAKLAPRGSVFCFALKTLSRARAIGNFRLVITATNLPLPETSCSIKLASSSLKLDFMCE